MARERDKADWNRTAGIIAAVRNAFRSDGKATQPDECTPYGKGSSKQNNMPLRRESIQVLKQFAKVSR